MGTIGRHPYMVAGFGLIVAVAVALLLYIGVSTATADEGKKDIKFTGTYVGGRTIDDSTAGILLVMTTDDGEATTLGEFTRTGFLVEDRTTVPKRCASGNGATGITGLVTYAFENGEGDDDDDILILERTRATICLDFVAGMSDVLLDFKVIGGTGRFEGAKGKIKEHAIGDFKTGLDTATLSGKIKLGKGKKK